MKNQYSVIQLSSPSDLQFLRDSGITPVQFENKRSVFVSTDQLSLSQKLLQGRTVSEEIYSNRKRQQKRIDELNIF